MYLLEAYVTNSSLNINYPFTYYSDYKVELFKRIKVKFSNSYTSALVISCNESNLNIEKIEEQRGYKLLKIIDVIDEKPIITIDQYNLALWLSKTTISPFISCLNTMLPKVLKTSKKISNAKQISKFKINELQIILTKKQEQVYKQLYDGILASEARKLSPSIIKKFLDIGLISEYKQEAKYENKIIEKESFKTLTKDQDYVYNKLIKSEKMVSLLFGITGSGKTEVYLHLAKHYLDHNKEVLILVPEISLTPQMIQRVKERFSDVVFYHSELSDQERYEQYKRIEQGEVKIAVGTRSSVFLPFKNLGLIIIDEEHDSSYKQDNTPTYSAKNVAFYLAKKHNCKVLLASATPSLESYTRALKGDYELLKLEKRINLNLPSIQIVDLTKQIKNRDSYIVSNPLKKELDNCINNKKQAIILLNRRGYSPIIKCEECSTTLMCSDCDIPLNYHKDENVLKCHQCGKVYSIPRVCPKCGNKSLIYYGFGTKKVEEHIRKLYPNSKVERMDRDNVGKKGSHEKILKAFGDKKIDILIGTQMIAKGLDYPDVTLVGILNADAGLMHQDYNSSKVTFDLLMQASGRSGRANTMGKVLIQAFNCEHYAIKAVQKQDYNYFYNIEMNYREKSMYPPYFHIVEIIVSDINNERLIKSVNLLYEKIEKINVRKYKPFELNKIKSQKRYRILLFSKDLVSLLNDLHIIINEYLTLKNVSHIKVDVDPLYLD